MSGAMNFWVKMQNLAVLRMVRNFTYASALPIIYIAENQSSSFF